MIDDNNSIVRMKLLKRAAFDIAYRFQARVYLVGSYIQKGDTAHDIDLFLVLTEDQYKRLFYVTIGNNIGESTNKVLSFRLKQKKYFEQFITDMDIDFKVAKEDRFFSDSEGDRICLSNGVV